MLKFITLCLIAGLVSLQAQTVTLSNRVLRSGGGVVAGASVTLAGAPQWNGTTDANGDFTLAQGTSILPGRATRYSFSLNRDGVSLVLDKSVANGRMELFAWNGERISSVSLDGMAAGMHRLDLPRLSMGVYFLKVRVNGETHAHKLLQGADGGFADIPSSEGSHPGDPLARLAKSSAAVTDTLVITKSGYETLKIPVPTLVSPRLTIVLKPLCTIPALPAIASLPANAKMPDPFKSLDGTRITTKEQWGCRRAEIDKQFQTYELGTKPPRPASVTGALSTAGDTLTITVGDGAKTMSFKVSVTKPAGTGPFPVLIGIGGSSLSDVTSLGVATLNFNSDEFAKNTAGNSDRGKGKFYEFFGASHSAGALMAWAWGVSRILDVLEMMPEVGLDPTRVAVTGCSRNGKGALIAGAFDERIILTLPQESGSGGAASWRGSDFTNSTAPNTAQALSEIVGEQPWFSTAFNAFNGKTNQLPIDHHMLEGLVSPRGLFVYENADYAWLGTTSTINNAYGARPIFQALGTSDAFSYSQLNGTSHCSFNATIMQPWITSYITKYLLNGAATKTSTIESKLAFTFDAAKWIDWTTPTLQ